MKTLFLAVPLMVVAATTVPALAHDDEGYPNDSHAADHREHYQYHEWANDAHERAHEEGFSSGGEHRAYHRWLRSQHEDFHEDHPNTWHDHYRRYRPWWWYGYGRGY